MKITVEKEMTLGELLFELLRAQDVNLTKITGRHGAVVRLGASDLEAVADEFAAKIQASQGKSVKRVAVVKLEAVKEPDLWPDMAATLGLSEEVRGRHFRYGEYADLELVISDDMTVVGGRILPQER